MLYDLEPETKIQLFELDTRPIGYAEVFYFHEYEAGPVTFNGNVYDPISLRISGFELSINTQPEPTLSIADHPTIRGWLKSRNYLRGATIRRLHTLAQYVGLAPSTAYLLRPTEEFFINRPSQISRLGIVFELRIAIDLFGLEFPGERIMKDEFPGVEQVRSET